MGTEPRSRHELAASFKNIAEYFSRKNTREVTFADADNYDYDIYNLFQEWQQNFPETVFGKIFPCFNKFWEELGSWNAQDDWTSEKSERIIALAKLALKEIENYEMIIG